MTVVNIVIHPERVRLISVNSRATPRSATDVLGNSSSSSSSSKHSSPVQSLLPKSTTPKPIEPPSQLPMFAYNVVRQQGPNKKNCVPNSTVIALSSAVRDLNTQHHLRVFPRNGFLLGIVRHGGFLPNERIDADLGVISTDIETLNLTVGRPNNVGNFRLTPKPTERHWANWKGNDPLHDGKHYPFFCVKIHLPWFDEKACSFYPYHNHTFFYPRPNVAGHNYLGNAKEMQRWNTQEANFRLVDTDELVTEENFKKGKQIGTVFPSGAFDCLVARQFYFTTILVPCEYEAILLAQYGTNWHRVENREKWEAMPLSEEHSNEILANGPVPLCA